MSAQRDAEPARSAQFARTLIVWQHKHGRHDLPWQHGEPYGVWVSEIMLQQTQVQTVIGYYARFMTRFPTLPALAAADEAAVMEAWSGLGYYARARNLHRAARDVMARFGGVPAHGLDVGKDRLEQMVVRLELTGQRLHGLGIVHQRDGHRIRRSGFRRFLLDAVKGEAADSGDDRADSGQNGGQVLRRQQSHGGPSRM